VQQKEYPPFFPYSRVISPRLISLLSRLTERLKYFSCTPHTRRAAHLAKSSPRLRFFALPLFNFLFFYFFSLFSPLNSSPRPRRLLLNFFSLPPVLSILCPPLSDFPRPDHFFFRSPGFPFLFYFFFPRPLRLDLRPASSSFYSFSLSSFFSDSPTHPPFLVIFFHTFFSFPSSVAFSPFPTFKAFFLFFLFYFCLLWVPVGTGEIKFLFYIPCPTKLPSP
jgi:hypothetical protein